VLRRDRRVEDHAPDPVWVEAHVGAAQDSVGRDGEQIPLAIAERFPQVVQIGCALGAVVGREVDSAPDELGVAASSGLREILRVARVDDRS
jgi:hypothetical protein